MTSRSYTVTVPRWLAISVVALVVFGGAFAGGIIVGRAGADTDSSASESTTVTTVVAGTTTTLAAPATTSTTAVSTSTTAKPKPKPKPKKVPAAPVVEAPAPLTATVTMTDNCADEGLINRVPGVLTVTWSSTSAVAWELKIIHGADTLFWDDPGAASGTKTFDRTCNNQRDARGVFNGKTLTTRASLTATGADGSIANDTEEGTF